MMVEMKEIGCMFMWVFFGLVCCCRGVFCLVGVFVVLFWWWFGFFFPLSNKKS